MSDFHKHQWKFRYIKHDNIDCADTIACDCGAFMAMYEIEDLLTDFQNALAHDATMVQYVEAMKGNSR